MATQDEKYLTFDLGEEGYAIPILKIREIIGMLKITNVPKYPNFIKGVINLRGKIIPIIDLRTKFELEPRAYDERTSIIVMEMATERETRVNGIVVDKVQEVISIDEENIEPPPNCTNSVEQDFLVGMGKVGEKVIMLLDADKILSTEELKTLEAV